MATHDYVIANASGAAVRSDLNNALAAIVSNNSNTTEPATTYAYQSWADTTAGLMKIRNSTNDGWVSLFNLDGSSLGPGKVTFGATEVVFNDAGNNVDFRIEGDTDANLFFVDASADAIGIGTTSPTFAVGSGLEIERAGSATLRIEDSASSSGFEIQNASSSVTFNGYNNQPFIFKHNTSERVTINSSGNVGIGTSPEEILHIKGPSETPADRDGVMLQHTTAAATADTGLPIVWSGYGSGALTNYTFASICGRKENGTSGDFSGYLQFATGSSGGSVAERARIDSSGRMAVGTTDPAGYGGKFVINISPSGDHLVFSDDSTSFGAAAARLGCVANDLVFKTNSGYSSATERMRIASNGYIYMYSVYNNAVAGSYRDVYIESGGFVGYLSSVQAHKTNIQPVEDVGWLYSLNPVSFNRRKKDETGAYSDEFYEENEYGLIAEEVEPVAPQLCFYDKDEETDEKTLAGVHYRQLITPMLKALQQANERIETLEAKVAALEAQ